jgi:uncharacterized protein
MTGGTQGSTSGDGLRPVPIQELRPLAEGRSWTLEQHLEGLASLTPVRGRVRAVHRGSVLEVEGEAETIVTLCCDRCLQHYNHPLDFRTRELLWLGDPARASGQAGLWQEGEAVLAIAGDELLDDLGEGIDPAGSFDPGHWTFEQLSLQLPLVNRCGPECPGPASWGHRPMAGDPRWSALAALRQGQGQGQGGPDASAQRP